MVRLTVIVDVNQWFKPIMLLKIIIPAKLLVDDCAKVFIGFYPKTEPCFFLLRVLPVMHALLVGARQSIRYPLAHALPPPDTMQRTASGRMHIRGEAFVWYLGSVAT
jgi:hypothetical protein